MALHTNIQINIGGNNISTFGQLMIFQEVNQHHFFELHCRGDAFMSLGGDIREQFNGKEIFISIHAVGKFLSYKEGRFKGIVNNVIESKSNSAHGDNSIIIKGQSPTILLDSGDHYASYSERTMKQIANEVMQSVQSNLLESEINPLSKQKFPYIVQYEEGGFQFLSRMARRLGEWCYYTGEKLIFGESQSEEIVLNYGVELLSFSLEANLKPAKAKMMANDFINNKVVSSTTTQAASNMNGYNQMSLKESETLFMKETVFLNHIAFTEDKYQQELDKAVKVEKAGKIAGMMVIRGKSDHPTIKLGSIVSIQDGIQNYGKFIITKIIHQCNGLGDYENSFQGVSASVEAPPYVAITSLPLADKQVAVVTDNNDPKGLGRIRVKFPWQEKAEKTPWIRVATPHSGADKGFHFLPEIGEEVLIDFEGKNAEKPFMSATFYHGKANPSNWNTKKNDIKAIKTRSGNSIIFNDQSGSVTITDQGTTSTLMDGNGNIVTNADANHTLNAGSTVSVNVGATEDTPPTTSTKMDASGNIEINADKKLIIKVGSSNVVINHDGSIEVKGKKILLKGDEIKMDATEKIEISGGALLDMKASLIKETGTVEVNS